MPIPVDFLGQAGIRLAFDDCVVYVDPYLTDSVAKRFGEDLRRLAPAPLRPRDVQDASWVLITHNHLDHCDPDTLLPLAIASPSCRFQGPSPVLWDLEAWGIAKDRLVPAAERWQSLSSSVQVHAVPAAHPSIERDGAGAARCVGYVFESKGRRIYHAGDTSPSPELERALAALRPIHTALVPVNERNYYREKRDIVGNMSVREAFQLAADAGVEVVVPIHWELFASNSVYREEIELVHRLSRPGFELRLWPEQL
jgi:L-ascorbate 6-phosphate lactonase